MIVGLQLFVDATRPLYIVWNNIVTQVFAFDANRVCAYAPSMAMSLHHRDYSRSINAAGKKRSQGDVSNHLHLHNSIEGFTHAFLPPAVIPSLFDLVKGNILPRIDPDF